MPSLGEHVVLSECADHILGRSRQTAHQWADNIEEVWCEGDDEGGSKKFIGENRFLRSDRQIKKLKSDPHLGDLSLDVVASFHASEKELI